MCQARTQKENEHSKLMMILFFSVCVWWVSVFVSEEGRVGGGGLSPCSKDISPGRNTRLPICLFLKHACRGEAVDS